MKTAFDGAGDIRGIDLLAAFVGLWREAGSGSLRFSRGLVNAGFDLVDGEIVAVFSSEPRFETSAILVRAGKLDAGALERLTVAPGGDGALAALAAGVLTKREWKWGEKIRAIEILADLLAWPEGFYFLDREAKPERGEFNLPLPRLVLELFLRSRDSNLIEHQLGPVDVPLIRCDGFEQDFANFGLTADAESVVGLIDGKASAAVISERAPAEEFAVVKLLAALKTLGLLKAGPRPSPERVESVLEPIEPVPSAPAAPAVPLPLGSWPPVAKLDPETVALPSIEEIPLEEPGPSFDESEEAGGMEASRDAAESDADLHSWQDRDFAAIVPESTTARGGWPEEDEEVGGVSRASSSSLEAEPAVSARGSSSSRVLLYGGLLLLLLLGAVAATILLRSRASVSVSRESLPRTPEDRTVTAVAPAGVFPAAATLVPPTSPPARTQAVRTQAARTQAVRTPAPTRVAERAPTAAATVSPPPRAVPVGASRAEWVERARRDASRLGSDKRVRYAIQLEVACEIPSLVEAWKRDRPAGSMWLLTWNQGSRQCFRVLWGRYRSLPEARAAKSGIPGYFVTSTNHPAVTAVR